MLNKEVQTLQLVQERLKSKVKKHLVCIYIFHLHNRILTVCSVITVVLQSVAREKVQWRTSPYVFCWGFFPYVENDTSKYFTICICPQGDLCSAIHICGLRWYRMEIQVLFLKEQINQVYVSPCVISCVSGCVIEV